MSGQKPAALSDPADKQVVILFGPGRSGTSSIAGSLSQVGFHVPKPVVGANESNPRGHFEPRWVMNFHKVLLEHAGVATVDSSPRAMKRVRRVTADPEVREQLRSWLAGVLGRHDRVIIKDPRSVLFGSLWIETCGALGVTPRFVTMLRHPAEVSGSRREYYAKQRDEQADRVRAISEVSGWINIALESERVTRGHPRVFVSYPELLGDWRTQLGRVGDALDLTFDPPVTADPHPIDDFIDPTLRRVQVDWDDLAIPDHLKTTGEALWQAFLPVTEGEEPARKEFNRIRRTYNATYADAVALTANHTGAARHDARVNTERRVREELADSSSARREPSRATQLWERTKDRARRSRLGARLRRR